MHDLEKYNRSRLTPFRLKCGTCRVRRGCNLLTGRTLAYLKSLSCSLERIQAFRVMVSEQRKIHCDRLNIPGAPAGIGRTPEVMLRLTCSLEDTMFFGLQCY